MTSEIDTSSDPRLSCIALINTSMRCCSACTRLDSYAHPGLCLPGLYGHSAVRQVDLATGGTLRKTSNKPHHFGEGIEIVGNRLLQLTWRENVVLEYSLPELNLLREVPVRIGREGWGLATDGELLCTDMICTRQHRCFLAPSFVSVRPNLCTVLPHCVGKVLYVTDSGSALYHVEPESYRVTKKVLPRVHCIPSLCTMPARSTRSRRENERGFVCTGTR